MQECIQSVLDLAAEQAARSFVNDNVTHLSCLCSKNPHNRRHYVIGYICIKKPGEKHFLYVKNKLAV